MFLRLAFVFALACAATGAMAQSTVRIRGTITGLEGNSLTVKSREGDTLTIRLTEPLRVDSVLRATLADIKPGTYIGCAALPQKDGPAKALAISIFSEAMRGTGEGSRPFDLMPESTMTNAAVAETVSSVDGPVMTLRFPAGEQKIVVAADTPIVTFAPATRTDIKAGEGIIIFGAEKLADGSLQTGRLLVGMNGVRPPM